MEYLIAAILTLILGVMFSMLRIMFHIGKVMVGDAAVKLATGRAVKVIMDNVIESARTSRDYH